MAPRVVDAPHPVRVPSLEARQEGQRSIALNGRNERGGYSYRTMTLRPPDGLMAFHRSLVTDNPPTESYRRAIHETVEPGDVVVDLGSGTGILAFLACEAGAARVYAVEASSAIEFAKLLARHNRLDDRVVFVNDFSHRVELAEPVDVVLTETIANCGLGEGIIGSVVDARERFLKPRGRVMPQWIEVIAAPVDAAEDYRRRADCRSRSRPGDRRQPRGAARRRATDGRPAEGPSAPSPSRRRVSGHKRRPNSLLPCIVALGSSFLSQILSRR